MSGRPRKVELVLVGLTSCVIVSMCWKMVSLKAIEMRAMVIDANNRIKVRIRNYGCFYRKLDKKRKEGTG